MDEFSSIASRIEGLLKIAIREEFQVEIQDPLRLQAPPDPTLGDFAFACFPLAKALRMAPPAIASRLAPRLQSSEILEAAQAAGPYLNLKVNKPFMAFSTLRAILDHPGDFGRCNAGGGARLLIEYSAPNTNKPQHLGHIRNNVLGISLTRLLDAAGYDVIPVNLINDRGVHICKSMLAYQKFGAGMTPAEAGKKGDHLVGDYYVRYDQEETREKAEWLAGRPGMDEKEADEAFIRESKLYAEAQEMLRKWEAGDKEVRALWEKMNAWVYEGFDETYKRLGCSFKKVYYESETYRLGKALVEEGLDKGVFFRKGDGSIWIDLTQEKLDEKLVLRADGTSVYITQDLGTTQLKFEDFQMERAIWIVADEQIYHFQVLFAVLKKLGFKWADGCYHLPYGMVDLPEGKMKSRTGTVVDADNLMSELEQMEIEEIRSGEVPIAEEDIRPTAEIIAQGALKFFILKYLPKTRMTFDPKESISPFGFTGPYIQYAYVRIQGIFRKADSLPGADLHTPEIMGLLTHAEEIAVIRKLQDFPDEVRISAETYNPSKLCAYLFELAREYNRFFHELPVLKADTENLRCARLLLSEATAMVLKNGLALLGIDVPDRM
ncbi:MAG: arginine--tRNA ligase [Planctomycetota bacterium]